MSTSSDAKAAVVAEAEEKKQEKEGGVTKGESSDQATKGVSDCDDQKRSADNASDSSSTVVSSSTANASNASSDASSASKVSASGDTAAPLPAAGASNANEDDYNPEEEVVEGDWRRPEVEVKEVKTETGEEEEDVFWKHRAKLYRWHKDEEGQAGEWKERGVGDAKLLQHAQTKKIRFLLRQEKTLKIVANHYVVAVDVYCKLQPNVSSDKIWVWTVLDFAEEMRLEQFALKFGQVEQAKIFKEKFEEAAKINEDLFGESKE